MLRKTQHIASMDLDDYDPYRACDRDECMPAEQWVSVVLACDCGCGIERQGAVCKKGRCWGTSACVIGVPLVFQVLVNTLCSGHHDGSETPVRTSEQDSVRVIPHPTMRRWLELQSGSHAILPSEIPIFNMHDFRELCIIRPSDATLNISTSALCSESLGVFSKYAIYEARVPHISSVVMLNKGSMCTPVMLVRFCMVVTNGDMTRVGIRGSLVRYVISHLEATGTEIGHHTDDLDAFVFNRSRYTVFRRAPGEQTRGSRMVSAWVSMYIVPRHQANDSLQIVVHAIDAPEFEATPVVHST